MSRDHPEGKKEARIQTWVSCSLTSNLHRRCEPPPPPTGRLENYEGQRGAQGPQSTALHIPVNWLSLLEAFAIYRVEHGPSTLFCGCLGCVYQLLPPPVVMTKCSFTSLMHRKASLHPADMGSRTQSSCQRQLCAQQVQLLVNCVL